MPYTYATPPAQPAVPRLPDPAIAAEAKRVLRESLETLSTCDDLAACHAVLTRPMAQLCEETRRRGLRAEQLIIAIKHAWATLPDTRWWRREADRELLSIVITVCVEQFFIDPKRARGALD
ncbi:MAG: hypothetical protein M3Z10_04440 [Gemmatimonadota bacterium]|nr:hypothetical protein [Gemmatimonadota bacterium]